jgi:hypothetical protein
MAGMGREIVYEGFLEVRDDGASLAQLYDLQGCFAYGRSPDEALSVLASRIPAYYAWLRRHDDYTPDVRGPFRVTPKEAARVPALDGHAAGAFFAPDAAPVTDEDLDWSLALLDWSYHDLTELLASLPPGALDAPLPNGQPLRALVDHIAQTQVWLISRLEARPTVPLISQFPGSERDHLRQVWQASLSRLRAASDDERQHLREHDGERWSLRKVLRRGILHLREHTTDLERMRQ